MLIIAGKNEKPDDTDAEFWSEFAGEEGDFLITRDSFKDAIAKWRAVKDDFKEGDHPRKASGPTAGQFVKKGQEGAPATKGNEGPDIKSTTKKEGGAGAHGQSEKAEGPKSKKAVVSKPKMLVTKSVEGKLTTAHGQPLPKHIQAVKIPPAWTDVTYSDDPNSELLAKGVDVKGRVQYIYSEKHWAKAAAKKFAKIDQLNKKFKTVEGENLRNKKKKEYVEPATVMDLIFKTGVRPGSDEDTKAKVKAYGATTLEGQHVVKEGAQTFLKFIGKKGVQNNIAIEDKALAAELHKRAAKGKDKKLFNVDSSALLGYCKTLDGGKFRPKDFRTLLGTKSAMDIIAKTEPPKNEKEYKKAVMSVAKQVASRLGNTPTVALSAYIHPVVFAKWKEKI